MKFNKTFTLARSVQYKEKNGSYRIAAYGCSIDGNILKQQHGSYVRPNMAGPFYYALGFSATDDYCALFVVDPRNGNTIDAVLVKDLGLQHAKLENPIRNTDFYVPGFIEECIQCYEDSDNFERAVITAQEIECDYQSALFAYKQLIKYYCRLSDESVEAYLKFKGIHDLSSDNMSLKLKNALELAAENVTDYDAIEKAIPSTKVYIEKYKLKRRRK